MIHGLILIRNTVQPLLTAVCYLSTMATSLQWALSLEDSPYTYSCLNLSTKAIFFYPQGGHCREFQQYSFDLQYLAFSGYPKCLPNLVNSSWLWRTGHFWVPPGLCIKTRLSVLMQIKLIFTRKFVHLASLWKWGFLELKSGQLVMGFEPIREGEIFWLNIKKSLLHRQTTAN